MEYLGQVLTLFGVVLLAWILKNLPMKDTSHQLDESYDYIIGKLI